MNIPPARKRPYYLNPLENLEDLFFYFGGVLKREPVRSKTGLRLSAGTLKVRFERAVEGSDIVEKLIIRNTWGPGTIEQIALTLEYVEPKQWEAARKEEMKRNPDGDRFYKDFQNRGWKNRYLSHEMFVDSLRCAQWLGCQLCYETSNLGRGLSTLAKLKIDPEDMVVEGDATIFQALYDEMEKRAEMRLTEEFGREREKWKNALRRRFVNIPVKFGKRFENASPPVLLRDYLVRLCRVYAAAASVSGPSPTS